ncbi:hypothetical protein BMETH_1869_1 [methanotrophic bacterial endosymbiont of Bathymodiolus sp.]|nr:hypothetical protein BMETH_1869_1 [methanotrophic bacterial endosymbiont of Bathymodiolus sp.]
MIPNHNKNCYNNKRFISLIKKQMVDADSVELVSESQSSETN